MKSQKIRACKPISLEVQGGNPAALVRENLSCLTCSLGLSNSGSFLKMWCGDPSLQEFQSIRSTGEVEELLILKLSPVHHREPTPWPKRRCEGVPSAVYNTM